MHEHDWNRLLLLGEGGASKACEGEDGAPLKQATAIQHWALSRMRYI
jgi:hypothetical protein